MGGCGIGYRDEDDRETTVSVVIPPKTRWRLEMFGASCTGPSQEEPLGSFWTQHSNSISLCASCRCIEAWPVQVEPPDFSGFSFYAEGMGDVPGRTRGTAEGYSTHWGAPAGMPRSNSEMACDKGNLGAWGRREMPSSSDGSASAWGNCNRNGSAGARGRSEMPNSNGSAGAWGKSSRSNGTAGAQDRSEMSSVGAWGKREAPAWGSASRGIPVQELASLEAAHRGCQRSARSGQNGEGTTKAAGRKEGWPVSQNRHTGDQIGKPTVEEASET